MEFQKYFQQYEDYFWSLMKYSDAKSDSLEYEMPFGGMIAYSEYIIETLEHLSEESWPPFGALLLAIIATNPNASADLNNIYNFGKSKEKSNSNPSANLFKIDVAVDFLKLLESLPSQYKVGKKRIFLFQTIFDKCHNRISKEKAKQFLDEYKLANSNLFEKIPFNDANFIKDFRTISLLKTKFPTVDSILNAMEKLPENKVDFEDENLEQDKVSEKPKDFVSQLIDENKTFHVGSLIKRIWSGLNIPLHHNTPSNQPLGGISDLTNKGDFDKLLISEFANDDLVFMSRLANNEVLYIQREVPPEDNKFKRILLIDSSLKNWGNPKIVNFATALAIAKHPKTDIECHLFVLGENHQKVEFETVHEVIDGLNLLSGKLDCSEGLNTYFQYAKELDEENENFLILSENSLKSKSMQKVIHENFDQLKYLITTNEEGEINIHKIKNKAKKHIKTIHLSLDDLWLNQSKIIKNELFEDNNELPVLYPLTRDYKNIFHYNSVFYTFSRGKLFQFIDVSKGFLKIAENIPFIDGKFALFENEKKEIILVNITNQFIQQYNISTKKEYGSKILRMNFPQIISLAPYKNSFYFKTKIGYRSLALESYEVEKNEILDVAFENYDDVTNSFRKQLYNSKNNYSVLFNMDDMWINETRTYLDFNNYGLIFNKLISVDFSDNDTFRPFETYVDLIFKNWDDGKSDLLNCLQKTLNINSFEAKEILNGNVTEILTNVPKKNADEAKYQIEDLGAVCYLRTNCHKTADGSTINFQDGIAILQSSNVLIPKIYIPMVVNGITAMSTKYEFAGNDYFLPKENKLTVISTEDFYEKYIYPFINTILDYGT